MARYSDNERIEAALKRLDDTSSRDEYEDASGELHRAAQEAPEEIVALYRRGAYSPFALVWSLQGRSAPPVIDLFAEALKHKDLYVRWAAAEGLLASRRADLEDLLIPALRDRSDLVRGVAAMYFEDHGGRRALPALKHLLELPSLRRNSPGIVDSAENAIARLEREAT